MSEIISMLNASTGASAEKVRTLLRSRSGDGRLFRYYVRTFGCQQNEADSEKLAGLAELMGCKKRRARCGGPHNRQHLCGERTRREKDSLDNRSVQAYKRE